MISANIDKEILKITFRDLLLFSGQNGEQIQLEYREIVREMPP